AGLCASVISPVSLHDALPISGSARALVAGVRLAIRASDPSSVGAELAIDVMQNDLVARLPSGKLLDLAAQVRFDPEHGRTEAAQIGRATSELQSLAYLVCRLL